MSRSRRRQPEKGRPWVDYGQASSMPQAGQYGYSQDSTIPKAGQYAYSQESPMPQTGPYGYGQDSSLPYSGQYDYGQDSRMPHAGQYGYGQDSRMPHTHGQYGIYSDRARLTSNIPPNQSQSNRSRGSSSFHPETRFHPQPGSGSHRREPDRGFSQARLHHGSGERSCPQREGGDFQLRTQHGTTYNSQTGSHDVNTRSKGGSSQTGPRDFRTGETGSTVPGGQTSSPEAETFCSFGDSRQQGQGVSNAQRLFSNQSEMTTRLMCTVPGCGRKFRRSTLPYDYIFESDVGSWIKGKKKRKQRREALRELFVVVSALLNGGGGVLYMHVTPNMLHFLDEQIDDVFMKLIPDGSLFGDNYERDVHEDQCHVILRVKPRERPLSTLDFKTRTSSNKGLVEMSHIQMRHRLINMGICASSPPPQQQSGSPPLPQQQQQQQQQQREQQPQRNGTATSKFAKGLSFTANFTQGAKLDGFHEDKSVEAKSVKYDENKTKDGETLARHAWLDLKLPERITAFSKEEDGGSYFLGIGEEQKEPEPTWQKVEAHEGTNLVGRSIWVAKSAGENEEEEIFYLAKEHQVPSSQERTGHFLCEGVPLPPNQHSVMTRWLREKIEGKDEASSGRKAAEDKPSPAQSGGGKRDSATAANKAKAEAQNMMWYPPEAFENQVEILFHPVQLSSNETGSAGGQRAAAGAARDVTSGPELYVIEVSVKPFRGLCFTDPEGPEAYKFPHPDSLEALVTQGHEQKAAELRPRLNGRGAGQLKPIRISWATWLEEQQKAVSEFQM